MFFNELCHESLLWISVAILKFTSNLQVLFANPMFPTDYLMTMYRPNLGLCFLLPPGTATLLRGPSCTPTDAATVIATAGSVGWRERDLWSGVGCLTEPCKGLRWPRWRAGPGTSPLHPPSASAPRTWWPLTDSRSRYRPRHPTSPNNCRSSSTRRAKSRWFLLNLYPSRTEVQ